MNFCTTSLACLVIRGPWTPSRLVNEGIDMITSIHFADMAIDRLFTGSRFQNNEASVSYLTMLR